MLARPERKMQMGLLAYIRRLFGGGDAEIRLMRLPQKTADAASNNKKVLPSVFLCSSAWKFSPAKKRKNKSGGKNPKINDYFPAFPANLHTKPTILPPPPSPGRLIGTRVRKNLFAPPVPFPNITTTLRGLIYKSSPRHLEAIAISCLRATLAKSDFLSFLLFRRPRTLPCFTPEQVFANRARSITWR